MCKSDSIFHNLQSVTVFDKIYFLIRFFLKISDNSSIGKMSIILFYFVNSQPGAKILQNVGSNENILIVLS